MYRLKYGDKLQIGDLVITDNRIFKQKHTIKRITKNFAFIDFNDIAEGKFPIVYTVDFQLLPKQKWNTCSYEIYRKECCKNCEWWADEDDILKDITEFHQCDIFFEKTSYNFCCPKWNEKIY